MTHQDATDTAQDPATPGVGPGAAPTPPGPSDGRVGDPAVGHRITAAPHDPEVERAATERAVQAAADSDRAAARLAEVSHPGPTPYAQQIEHALSKARIWHGPDGTWGYAETPALTNAVLAVRDERMEQLRAENQEMQRDHAEDRDALGEMRGAIQRLRGDIRQGEQLRQRAEEAEQQRDRYRTAWHNAYGRAQQAEDLARQLTHAVSGTGNVLAVLLAYRHNAFGKNCVCAGCSLRDKLLAALDQPTSEAGAHVQKLLRYHEEDRDALAEMNAALARVRALANRWDGRLLPSLAFELLSELRAVLDQPAGED